MSEEPSDENDSTVFSPNIEDASDYVSQTYSRDVSSWTRTRTKTASPNKSQRFTASTIP